MAEAVSAEITLPPMSTEDTVHDLMTRRRDAAKNRLRFHLTETDCVLICTHGSEKYYQHGEVIVQAGQPITTVYRIKSGRICLVKDGKRLYNLAQGFFIGEGLFIHNEGEYQDYFGASLVANGPVIVTEVNIPFVRQLLEADKVLSFKMYRHIAGKLSALLLSILGSVAVEEYVPNPESTNSSPMSARSASTGSLPSIDSVSSISSGSEVTLVESSDPKSIIMTEEMVKESATRVGRKPHKLHRVTHKLKQKTPFKVYHLDSGHLPVTCQLTTHKIIILHGAAGIKSKRKIKYNKILDINKTGPNTATIIYGVQARTFFFKQQEELDEFCGIVSSLIPSENKQMFNTQIAPNLSTSPPPMGATPVATSPPPCSPEAQAAHDKAAIHQLATRQDLKKGELVIAEGDLYQRIYTLVSGEVHMKKKGHHIVTLRDGEVFGVLSLFHLRPSMLDVEVVSETATFLIIPGYKIADLVNTNFPLAVRMHKNAAQLIYSQVGQILKSHENPVEPFSDTHVIE